MANTEHAALTLNGLTGFGATLAIDVSRDGGVIWVTTGMSATDYDLGISVSSFTDDIDYWLLTRTYTHVQVRVATAGTGAALVLLVSLARGLDTYGVNTGGGGTGGTVSDPALEAAVGAPGDASGANTLVGKAKELVNTSRRRSRSRSTVCCRRERT